jgi:hypothetical protein
MSNLYRRPAFGAKLKVDDYYTAVNQTIHFAKLVKLLPLLAGELLRICLGRENALLPICKPMN